MQYFNWKLLPNLVLLFNATCHLQKTGMLLFYFSQLVLVSRILDQSTERLIKKTSFHTSILAWPTQTKTFLPKKFLILTQENNFLNENYFMTVWMILSPGTLTRPTQENKFYPKSFLNLHKKQFFKRKLFHDRLNETIT